MKRYNLSITTLILLLCIIFILVFEIIINITPPISRDALIHHLAIPKIWLEKGFIEIKWADFSYYPMYINILYFICLFFNNDILPKYIHLLFGLGTGLLIFQYLKNHYNKDWALLGLLIFFSTPIIIWLSTSAYIDLGMTFFIAASMLFYTKWREGNYNNNRKLYLSAIFMGIAVGSKYNSLIGFFFQNLILVYYYSKDTSNDKKAIKYGLIFFIISIATSSPWFIKNFILTGNPFYPLYNGIFYPLLKPHIKEVLNFQGYGENKAVAFFTMRELLYGENFFETLTIPIRMFFQGDDQSYQYFQGVLNPILIIFLPFVFLKKKYHKDMSFFACFSIYFICVAYFTTCKQIRYITPTLPFLSILSVCGIRNFLIFLTENKMFSKISKIILISFIIFLLSLNFQYLIKRFNLYSPINYITNNETKSQYLSKHLKHYDSVKFINENLPENSKVFLMFIGRRAYYLNVDYMHEPKFGMNLLNLMLKKSMNNENIMVWLESNKITHILMRAKIVDKYLNENFSIDDIKKFMNLFNKHAKTIYNKNGYMIWKLIY